MLTATVDEYLETEYPKFEETFEDLYSLSISSQEEDSILNLENELNLLSRKSPENTVENTVIQEPENILENISVPNTPVQDSLEILKFKKQVLLEKQKELEILQKEFQIQNQNSKIEILELKKEISLKSQENLELKRENTTVLKEMQELKQENSEIVSNSKNLEIKNISLQELIKNLKLELGQEQENSREILDNLEKLKLDKKRGEENSRDILEKEKVFWEQEKVKEIKEIKEKLSKSCTDAYSSSISRVQSHLEQEKKSLLEDFERDKQMIKVKNIHSITGFFFKGKRYADKRAFRREEKTFRRN
jgi:hypothetical protein